MTGIRPLPRAAVQAVLFALSGCVHHGGFTTNSADWDPQDRARRDAIDLSRGDADEKKPRADANGIRPVRTSATTQADRKWTIDPLYLLSFPAFLIWDGLRHVYLTDTDPVSRPRFETLLFFAPNPDTSKSPVIGEDEPFEVNVRYIAIDCFSGGRLRDAWGGQGGAVSVQTSLNALSDAGMPLREDTKFVVENQVKRRNALLAIAKGTARGGELVQKIEIHAKELLDKAQELGLVLERVKAYVEKIQSETKDRAARLTELRTEAIALIDEKAAGLFQGSDESALLKRLAESVVDSIFDEVARHLNDPDVSDAQAWVGRVTKLAGIRLEKANVILDFLDRTGVDEEGIYEAAKIIVGLADADRLSTLEFENVKPSLLQFGGEAGGGTAATLIGDDFTEDGTEVLNGEGTDLFRSTPRDETIDHGADRDLGMHDSAANPVVSSRGLVYRGTLRELSRTMPDVKGFSLSFLMIDRGDDRVVRTLRTLQQYSAQSGITIGGGGTQIQLAAIIDGLAALAERISEDKVELRSLDVRFLSGRPRSGATPGHELFALRPCTILISRNLSGRKFGAVAEISISRVK